MAVRNGTAAADTLNGTSGADTLNGAGGSDTLVGGTGIDRLNGGSDNDFYVIGANPGNDRIVEAAAGGTDTVRSSVTYSIAPHVHVENLTLTGGSNITGTGNNLANVLTGNAGNNVLNGGGGHDTLNGGAGNDTMAGGTGNDTYTVNAAGDVVTESANQGTDTVKASITWSLGANVERLTLTGTAEIDGAGSTLNNVITGNSAENLLDGKAGNDTLNGAGGDDYLIGRAGDDVLNGGAGADVLLGGAGDDVLVWDAGDVVISGGAGADTLRVDGAGVTFDLAAVQDGQLQGIEIIDITGSGDNTLEITANALKTLFPADTVRVTGDEGDAVIGGNGWVFRQTFTEDGTSYLRVARDGATLEIERSVDRDFDAVLPLSALDGTSGFRLDGIDANDESGRSVASAGDVNGDGYDDFIIGAYLADAGGDSGAGESYVVFGRSSFGSSVDLATLNGTDGFRLDGIDVDDLSGVSVASAGDVNGDGYDDVIIGARWADADGDSDAGESYVVFGRSSFGSSVNLATLDGTDGFRLDGIDANDESGRSVASAGDVNGDGYDDVIIGAYKADAGGDGGAGESYVVFGRSSFAASVDLGALNGTDGFRLDGIDADDLSGRSVASAGDVNGDGYDDVIIGAHHAAAAGDSDAGESYVVFGRSSFAASVDLGALNGTDGFRLDGIDADDRSGSSVASAGDVNGDGYDDLIIGAYLADAGGDSGAGESYVVFGGSSFASSVDLGALNGADGFRLDGIGANDGSGWSVASAGDMNGDGYDDLIISAQKLGEGYAGASYVVFGGASFASSVDLGALDGFNGFRLDGIDNNDRSGKSVASAGDVNGDGYDDLIVGAPRADPGGDSSAGESYVVYGGNLSGAVTHGGTAGADTLAGGAGADNMLGGAGNDVISGGANADRLVGGSGNDTLNGGAGADRLEGGEGEDSFVFSSAPAADQILDFASGIDHIVLDRTVFSAFTAAGTVIAASVQVATSGAINGGSGDTGDFLKYASDTGQLYYDADGSGAGGLQLIATVKSGGLMGQSPAVFQFHPTLDIVIVD